MFRISKDHHFSYSHQLGGLAPDHPCSRLHGHNAIVRVTLASCTLDSVGFVKDYAEMGPLFNWMDDQFDHKHLNDVVNFNPTAERLAEYVFTNAHHVFDLPVLAVAWSETPKTWAEYRR